MLLNAEDAFAIHSLAAAGFRILRDLAGQNGSHIDSIVKQLIVPGTERQFWSEFSSAANFLKHADKDADEIYENFKEEWNESLLSLATFYYQSLGQTMTPEMLTVCTFFAANHPEFVQGINHPQLQISMKDLNWFAKLNRKEQLAFARKMLESQKRSC